MPTKREPFNGAEMICRSFGSHLKATETKDENFGCRGTPEVVADIHRRKFLRKRLRKLARTNVRDYGSQRVVLHEELVSAFFCA